MDLTRIIITMLAVQGLRYLIFDQGVLEFIWKRLRDKPLLGKFLSCPFCQGFWMGLAAFFPQTEPLLAAGWGLASAWIAATATRNRATSDADKPVKKTVRSSDPVQCKDFDDEVVLLECNIDDMSGEFFGDLMDRLFREGALDVWFTSAYGKKNRPLYQLSSIFEQEKEEDGIRVVLTHSSTAGVRRRLVRRTVMDRSFIKVDISGESVAVKKLVWKDVVKYTPEWEDCAKASKKLSKPVAEIYAKAQAKASALFD